MIMQMPRGVPVATVAINNATNAGLLAVRMLGMIQDADLLARFCSDAHCVINLRKK
jgi:phosphoribosylaminoimidazole carboxylase